MFSFNDKRWLWLNESFKFKIQIHSGHWNSLQNTRLLWLLSVCVHVYFPGLYLWQSNAWKLVNSLFPELRMFISASRPWKWMVYQYWENPFLSISALSLASCIIRLSLDIQLYFPQTFFSLDPIHSIQYLFPREIMDLLSIWSTWEDI